jgi:cytochrome c peroxidase
MVNSVVQLSCLRSLRVVLVAGVLSAVSSMIAARSVAFDSRNDVPVVETFPIGLPAPPSVVESRSALVDYGQFLFQSPLLSRDGSIACVSCHDPSRALAGPARVAIGIGGEVGRRHPPALFNLYAANVLMWDGRAPNLDQQIHLPLESSSEMDIDWPAALGRLSKSSESLAFLTRSERQIIDKTLVLAALASYVGTLVSGGSAFDRYYYAGDERALSEDAKEGLTVFVRKARCSSCHLLTGYSALLTDNNFHSVGVGAADGKYKDAGRFEVTAREGDRGLFKTPSLRNVALRPYFMHDGSMGSLREVVNYYNRGGNRGALNLDQRIRPLFMSEAETEKLLTFLNSLNSPIVSYRPWLRSNGATPVP